MTRNVICSLKQCTLYCIVQKWPVTEIGICLKKSFVKKSLLIWNKFIRIFSFSIMTIVVKCRNGTFIILFSLNFWHLILIQHLRRLSFLSNIISTSKDYFCHFNLITICTQGNIHYFLLLSATPPSDITPKSCKKLKRISQTKLWIWHKISTKTCWKTCKTGTHKNRKYVHKLAQLKQMNTKSICGVCNFFHFCDSILVNLIPFKKVKILIFKGELAGHPYLWGQLTRSLTEKCS